MTDDPLSSNDPRTKGRGVMAIFNTLFRKHNGEGEHHAEAETPETGELVSHAREFQDLRVEDVMTPRADIVAIEQSCGFAEVVARFVEAEHSRMPVYAETLDEAYRSRERYGAPPWEVAGWVTTYAAIASGELDVVTNHVEQLAGQPPMSLGDLLAGRTMNR